MKAWLLLPLIATLGCQGRMIASREGEGRGGPLGVASAAPNAQFSGSDPLPQLVIDRPRRRSAIQPDLPGPTPPPGGPATPHGAEL